ncbi:MAG TPA: ATP-binding cassette domain-containing protein, partial [Aliiroseovarius sp.]|nr:ATP-binding cassette domain-containing protein [Aliiroseovarius sp.]
MIELNEVSYGYGGVTLLSDVSLKLAPGSFHFLTGPSGAGKTTLIKLCYGELVAGQGRVSLFGRDVREMSRDDVAMARRRIGVVHQDCQFLDHLSVAENVALPIMVTGREMATVGRDLDDLLGWVGLTGQTRALPPALSG